MHIICHNNRYYLIIEKVRTRLFIPTVHLLTVNCCTYCGTTGTEKDVFALAKCTEFSVKFLKKIPGRMAPKPKLGRGYLAPAHNKPPLWNPWLDDTNLLCTPRVHNAAEQTVIYNIYDMQGYNMCLCSLAANTQIFRPFSSSFKALLFCSISSKLTAAFWGRAATSRRKGKTVSHAVLSIVRHSAHGSAAGSEKNHFYVFKFYLYFAIKLAALRYAENVTNRLNSIWNMIDDLNCSMVLITTQI